MRTIDRSKLFLALLAGVLQSAAFPRLGLFPLAGLALVPLLLAIRDVSPWDAFRLAFAAGLVFSLTLLYWIAPTVATFGHLPLALAVGILMLLCAYIAGYTGLFGFLAAKIGGRPLTAPLILASTWAALEYLRGNLLTGFPWGFLGHSQFPARPLIQIVDITGVYGVSWLLVLINGALLLAVLARSGKTWQGTVVTRRAAWGWGLAALGLVVGVLLYGGARIARYEKLGETAPAIRVAVVQGNIPQDLKWNPAFQITTTKKYIRLSQEAAAADPDLVVWPETATPFYLFHNAVLTRMVLSSIAAAGKPFLIGSPYVEAREGGNAYHNSAFLFDAQAQPKGRYDKAHLVPFGEYVPLRRWLPFLGKIVAQVGDFDAGEPGGVLRAGGPIIGPLICYEGIFPELARAATRNGAALLVNLTNDAWYGRTSAPYQHFALAAFRAVENRRPLVRAANTGISGFVDASGRPYGTTRIFEDALTVAQVAMPHELTFYTRHGDLFAIACLVGMTLALIAAARRRRRRKA
jgi:apolipoprotein N-acyltransferase